MQLVYFFAAWWLNHIGLVWYTVLSVWNKDIEKAFIMAYAYTTRVHFFKCGILCAIMYHVIVFFTVVMLYMYEFRQKILAISCCTLALLPNINNPYNSLILKLPVYCIVVARMKETSHIYFSWILFTHGACLVFLPFQIVYDTYYNKISITV